MEIKISILIIFRSDKLDKLSKIIRELDKQCSGLPIEILSLINDTRPIIEIKNILMKQATGKFTVFIDHDDHIGPNYLRSLLDNIENSSDFYKKTDPLPPK